MSDQIIIPAPAQANMNANQPATQAVVPPVSKTKDDSSIETNESQIKDLSKQLRVINNVCSSMVDFIKFNENIPAESRVMIESSYYVGMMYSLKAIVKSLIDDEYMNITEPPPKLNQAMEKAYTNIDSVCETFARSMKDVIELMKNYKGEPKSKPQSKPSQSILSAMTNTESSLP